MSLHALSVHLPAIDVVYCTLVRGLSSYENSSYALISPSFIGLFLKSDKMILINKGFCECLVMDLKLHTFTEFSCLGSYIETFSHKHELSHVTLDCLHIALLLSPEELPKQLEN